jgi:hypothetical protein
LGILVYTLKRKIGFIENNKKYIKRDEETEENNIEENSTEMEDIFYNRVNAGGKYIKLLKVYNDIDIMFIETIFKSEQIPFKTELLKFYKSSYIFFYILEEDYNDAIIVVEDYLSNKNNTGRIDIEIYKK